MGSGKETLPRIEPWYSNP